MNLMNAEKYLRKLKEDPKQVIDCYRSWQNIWYAVLADGTTKPCSEDVGSPITHVAVRFREVVYSLPKPNRHHHVFQHIIEENAKENITVNRIDSSDPDDQGFVDADGNYLNREQGLARAIARSQIVDMQKIYARQLFSENLW